MTSPAERDRALAALADPRRRAIHRFASVARRPVTRDDVAEALDVPRPTAAFHLDRLVEVGLLAASYARPPGRAGPGAGRPTKWYKAVDVEVEISVPTRDYARLAGILVDAAAAPEDDGVLNRAVEVAYRQGREHARDAPDEADPVERLSATLDRLGYVCDRAGADRLTLRNCPFRSLAHRSPEVVCVLNERYLAGLVSGLGLYERFRVVGDGVSPDCCVTLTAR